MDKEKLEQSLETIRQAYAGAIDSETPLFVNFSGGKDSSCVLLLAKMVAENNVEAIYMSSGIELPGTIEFVEQEAKKYDVKLHIVKPDEHYLGDFEFWVRKFGYFPACGYTFCSSRLKIRPARAYLRKLYGKKHMYRMNGVRKPESTRRTKMYKDALPIDKDGDLAGSFKVMPILEWTDDDVKEFLAENNVSIHKQYSEFGVSGCAYCPFYQVYIFQKILNVYPNIYDNIIKLEEELGQPAVKGHIFLGDIKKEMQ